MFGAFAASTGSLGVTVGNVQRPATVSFGLRASPQLTALFTSAAILFSSAAVNSVRAYEVGHMSPSSRLAASWKPNVAYRALNFAASWKKHTTLPPLAYAGIPYQVLGSRSGALARTISWIRSAMARSGCGMEAILSRRACSGASPRAAAFRSLMVSFIAAISSLLSPSYFAVLAVVRLAVGFFVVFPAAFFSGMVRHLLAPARAQRSSWMRIRLPAGSRKVQSRIP